MGLGLGSGGVGAGTESWRRILIRGRTEMELNSIGNAPLEEETDLRLKK